MRCHKKNMPALLKYGGTAALVIAGFLLGYLGYSLFQDKNDPILEPPVQEQRFPPASEPVPTTVVRPTPAAVPEMPQQTPARPPAWQTPEKPGPSPVKAASDGLWLHIVKSDYKMYLYNGTRIVKAYNIAVGANGGQKQRVGDSRTPTGNFSVQQIQNSSAWTYDFKDGNGPTPGAYGPWFIRLNTPGWSGIGIHGTHDPGSIGTMITQGCVRMYNNELEELKKSVFRGMKVRISE